MVKYHLHNFRQAEQQDFGSAHFIQAQSQETAKRRINRIVSYQQSTRQLHQSQIRAKVISNLFNKLWQDNNLFVQSVSTEIKYAISIKMTDITK